MNTVVYYPHQTPSPKWLKLAALCWDKVYRLTPNNFKDPPEVEELDSILGGMLASVNITDIAADTEVQASFKAWATAKADELRTETGFYWSEKPFGKEEKESWTKEQLNSESTVSDIYKLIPSIYTYEDKKDQAKQLVPMSESKFYSGGNNSTLKFDFISFLDTLGLIKREQHPVEIRVPKWHAEYYLRYYGTMNAPPEPGPKPGSAHEKYEKLIGKIGFGGYTESSKPLRQEADKILQDNLVTVTPKFAGSTMAMYMPKEVALHYLSLCALKAATDGKRDLAAFDERFTDVVFNDVQALKGYVATTLLEAYLPENFDVLAPERIAEIKAELATNRLKYDKAVQSLCKEYVDVASEGELGKLNSRIIGMAKERVEDTKNTYKRAKLQMILQSFGISLTPPALAGSIASVLGIGIFAPIGIAAALSAFAAKSFLDWDKAKAERSKSPWSYILDVSRKTS